MPAAHRWIAAGIFAGAVAAGLLAAVPPAVAEECPKLAVGADGTASLAMEQHDGKVTEFELGPETGRLEIVSRGGKKRTFIVDGATEVYCAAEPEPGRSSALEACLTQGLDVYVDWFVDAQCRQRAYRIFDADQWSSGLIIPPPSPELAEKLVPLKRRPRTSPER